MIDRFVIDRLEATPIEGVAQRLGLDVNRHKCLCPFHDDSRPSLTFNTYRNRYRCYVCDAHGGVIDLVKGVKGIGFKDACNWLDSGIVEHQLPSIIHQSSSIKTKKVYPPDLDWLSQLVRTKVLTLEARRFLFEERHIDPRVVSWCGLTSISEPQPCWRYGKPFYDAPSLLIPYYDIDGRLLSVQSRYLGSADSNIILCEGDERVAKGTEQFCAQQFCNFANTNHNSGAGFDSETGVELALKNGSEADTAGGAIEAPTNPQNIFFKPCASDKPRFRFPRGSDCHIYGLQILRMLRPGDQLWITEGCSDCWAMLSSGKKAIAIPSATLLKDKDVQTLLSLSSSLSLTLHMYPDQDRPGEKLFLELRERLPNLERHQLPEGCKDFGDYWKKLNVKS